ncbi:MAG: hypothetical protein EA362_01290 [Saprospirales bacterium]|nr:MAG: hypothetical protein EA362_01290 [Saprospirales bacterium]
MKAGLLLFFNAITLIMVLIANFIFGSGALGMATVGEISASYPTLLTPAGYAFSIWGFIYLLLIGFVVYQAISYKNGTTQDALIPSGWWFSLSNLFNILWIVFWVNDMLAISTLLIFGLLFCLIKLTLNLRLEIWDAPLRVIAFVWWPICFYIGWIVLASVLNVAVLLVALEWGTFGLKPEYWAVGTTIIAVAIYFFLTFKRNMRETALVGCWGFLAVAFNSRESSELVSITAFASAALLFLLVNFHAFRNYNYLPVFKWQRGEI